MLEANIKPKDVSLLEKGAHELLFQVIRAGKQATHGSKCVIQKDNSTSIPYMGNFIYIHIYTHTHTLKQIPSLQISQHTSRLGSQTQHESFANRVKQAF